MVCDFVYNFKVFNFQIGHQSDFNRKLSICRNWAGHRFQRVEIGLVADFGDGNWKSKWAFSQKTQKINEKLSCFSTGKEVRHCVERKKQIFFYKIVVFLRVFFSFLLLFQLDGFHSTPIRQEIELLLGKEENNPIICAGLSTLLTVWKTSIECSRSIFKNVSEHSSIICK